MNGINISVNVSVDFSESTKAFIAQLFTSTKPAAPAVPAVPAAPAAPATPAAPAAPATRPAAPVAPAAPAAKPAAPVSGVTIEQVRQALAQKVNNHREEIKAKLNELGAPSVTKLDPAKYAEMLSFLSGLA